MPANSMSTIGPSLPRKKRKIGNPCNAQCKLGNNHVVDYSHTTLLAQLSASAATVLCVFFKAKLVNISGISYAVVYYGCII